MATQNRATAEGATAAPSTRPLQRAGASTESALRPAVDIHETAEEIVLRADMPGVTRERLGIRIDGNNLLIEGTIENRASGSDDRRVRRRAGDDLSPAIRAEQ